MEEETKTGGTALMAGILEDVFSISHEKVRVMGEVLNVRLGMTLHGISPPHPPISSELASEINLWTGITSPQ